MSGNRFQEPCGGCGQEYASKRCIGCHHEMPSTSALASSQAEIERLRAALEFYADPNRYQGPNQRADVNEQHRIAGYRIDVTRDGGEIARAALSGSKE